MKVEIWSDIVCPWCYVGKRNFEAALDRFPHAAGVQVEWKAYELDPSAPPEREGSYAERLAEKYGTSLGEAKAMIARMVAAGTQAGVEMRFDVARPGNTFDAHRLLHLAAKRGVQNELKELLLRATFTEGRPIADHGTLRKVAAEAGLDRDEVGALLESDQFADGVRGDEREAMEIGVRGVPFFVFDRKYAVSGARPPEVFVEVLQRVWREANPIEIVGAGEAGFCEDGSCEI